MKAKSTSQLAYGPVLPLAKLVERHEARMAMIGHNVKAILASDEMGTNGQIGQMSSRLHEVMVARGIRPADLARAASMDPSTLSKLEGGKRKMNMLWARQLAPHLGVQPDDLMVDIGRPIPEPVEGALPPSIDAAPLSQSRLLLPQRHEMPRDVPVFGTAMGANGDGAFVMNMTGQIDTVRRGPGIMNNRGVFAIYVEGDSMTPRYEPGELVYLDKNRPIKPGDDVVLVMASPEKGVEPRAYLKRLVRRTADRWICEQFNPPGKMVEFPVDAMQDKFRVLRWQEVMGL